MSQFKVGDRVIILDKPTLISSQKIYIGTCQVIAGLNDMVAYMEMPKSEGIADGFYFNELELEHIYNSPFYQALV